MVMSIDVEFKKEYCCVKRVRIGTQEKGDHMNHEMLDRRHRIVNRLSKLPRVLARMHGRDNLSEFLLHELSSEPYFNLNKAAFFVDNPDFNCLRGIAGFSAAESYKKPEIWTEPDNFSEHMLQAPFNNKVRAINHYSINNKDHGTHEILEYIAKKLDFERNNHCLWHMKHDNVGLLLYEKNNPEDTVIDDHIVDGMSLLSFCPIF